MCSTDRVFNLTDPQYLDPREDNILVKLPEGVPLGGSDREDTLIVSLIMYIVRSPRSSSSEKLGGAVETFMSTQ